MLFSATTGMYQSKKDGLTAKDSIAACARAGFPCVDVMLHTESQPGGAVAEDSYLAWADEIGQCLEDNHIVANQAHALFYLHGTEQEAFNVEMVRRNLEIAGRLHIPWIVMHILRVKDLGTTDKTIAMEKNAEYFYPYGELARKYGTGIAIENGLTGFYHGADELLTLCSKLNDPAFGLCWDTGHANITGQNQPEAILQMGKLLKTVHINDNNAVKDQHLLPGGGTVNFAPIMAALHKINFANELTLEATGEAAQCPADEKDAFLQKSADVCKLLLSL